jgi:hypothetical protein
MAHGKSIELRYLPGVRPRLLHPRWAGTRRSPERAARKALQREQRRVARQRAIVNGLGR